MMKKNICTTRDGAVGYTYEHIQRPKLDPRH